MVVSISYGHAKKIYSEVTLPKVWANSVRSKSKMPAKMYENSRLSAFAEKLLSSLVRH